MTWSAPLSLSVPVCIPAGIRQDHPYGSLLLKILCFGTDLVSRFPDILACASSLQLARDCPLVCQRGPRCLMGMKTDGTGCKGKKILAVQAVDFQNNGCKSYN